MKIMVSACLLGENCKYNGGNNRNQDLLRMLANHIVIPVCPEVLGGLPTPRVPAEIVDGIVMNRDGVSVDSAFRRGAEKATALAIQEQPDLIILQPRSPSCGVNQIYDGTFSGKRIRGSGIFAEQARQAGFHVMDAEDVCRHISNGHTPEKSLPFRACQPNPGQDEKDENGVCAMAARIRIADTTREEREQIVAESIGNLSGLCDGCSPGIIEMYQDYIDGRKELREVNAAFNARYISGMQGPERNSCAADGD